MRLDLEIEGVRASIQALNNLGGVLADQGYESGLLAVARIIRRGAEATNLHKDTGRPSDTNPPLRKSWKVSRGKQRYRPSALVFNIAPHASLILLGAGLKRRRVQRSTGRYTGQIQPRRIIQRAQEDNEAAILQAFKGGVDREASKIQRELARGVNIRARTLRNV